MFTGTIKKDVTKAMQELIAEGTVNQLVSQIVEKLVNNTSLTYDPKTKSVILKFKKEF